jgi:hypothetical protein
VEASSSGTVAAGTLRRAIAASAIGNATEWFDCGVYAYGVKFIANALFSGNRPQGDTVRAGHICRFRSGPTPRRPCRPQAALAVLARRPASAYNISTSRFGGTAPALISFSEWLLTTPRGDTLGFEAR